MWIYWCVYVYISFSPVHFFVLLQNDYLLKCITFLPFLFPLILLNLLFFSRNFSLILFFPPPAKHSYFLRRNTHLMAFKNTALSHTHLFSAVDTLQVERGDIGAVECFPSVLSVALQNLTLQLGTHRTTFITPANNQRERARQRQRPSSIIVTFLSL